MRRSLINVLFPKTRQAILTACLLRPDKWWYLSDLSAHLNVTPSTLQRELASLTAATLLETRKDGNRVYYKANLDCPGIEDLQSLLIKTVGVADIVSASLKGFLEKIDFAFIYGSLARGEEIATSDVDVFLVGEIKMSQISGAISKTEKTLGREINPTIFSKREFLFKMKNKDSFVKTVLDDKKIFLKGSEVELKTLDQRSPKG